MRGLMSLLAGILLLATCGSIEPAVPTLADPPGGIASPYFAGVSAALRKRDIELSAPTVAEARRAMAPAGFVAKVRAEATGQAARVVSVHLAIADSKDARDHVDHPEVYVVGNDRLRNGQLHLALRCGDGP